MQAARRKEAEEAGRSRRPNRALRVSRTPVGLGVFAQRRYQVDQVVGEIGGEIIDDPDYGSPYCMDFGDDRCLEPSPPFRYMNHSCEPNCRFMWYDVSESQKTAPTRRMFVIALDEIRPGDELTIDYNWPARMAIPCLCHAPSCRGWIVAEEELARVVAQRGLGTARPREVSESAASGSQNNA